MKTSSKFALVESGLAVTSALLAYPKVKHQMNVTKFHTIPKNMKQFDHNFNLAQNHGYVTSHWGSAKFYIRHQDMYIGSGHLTGTLYQVLGNYASVVRTINFTGRVVAPKDSSRLLTATRDSQDTNQSLKSIHGLKNLDTSQVVNMSEMFYKDQSLWTLDLSHWDVSKVQDMFEMFYGDYDLRSLSVDDWQVGRVKDFTWAFRHVPAANYLDLSSLEHTHDQNMDNNYAHLMD